MRSDPNWTQEELAYGEGWRRGYVWGKITGALCASALLLFVIFVIWNMAAQGVSQ